MSHGGSFGDSGEYEMDGRRRRMTNTVSELVTGDIEHQ